MAELQKMKRSLAKQDPTRPMRHCSWSMRPPAVTRSLRPANSINASDYRLIVTKLDGSGKGGIIVAIQENSEIPRDSSAPAKRSRIRAIRTGRWYSKTYCNCTGFVILSEVEGSG